MNQTFSGKTKKNNGLQDFIDTLGKIILAIFRIIGKFIGVIIIFISAAVILSLIIGGFSLGSLEWLNVEGDFLQYPPFFYDSVIPIWLLTLCGFFLIGIPFLILFILGLRILSSNVKKVSKPTSLTLLGIWIVCLLVMIFTGLEYGTSHSTHGQSSDRNNINIVKNDTLNLKIVNDDEIFYRHNLRSTSKKEEVYIDHKQMVYSNNVNIKVKKSNSDESYMVIVKESRGQNKSNASFNAEKINYKYKIEGNTLVLDAYYLSSFKNMWKSEEVNITVFIPEDVTIYFDNSVKYFLDDVKNEGDIYDRDMVNHHFIMTDETLKCTDCIDETEEDLDEETV